MKKSAKSFFHAMGSILDLCPAGSYGEYRSSSCDIESMSSDWKNVGGLLREAIADHEPTKITQKNHSEPTH